MKFTAPRALGATLFLLGSLTASPVFAHAHLQQQTPAANSEVSPAPQTLTLNFSEGIEPGFSGVTLTGPEKRIIPVGKAVRNEKDNTQLVIPLNETLGDGLYTVEWHVVSVDGHKTKGQYQFSVK
ncbi:MULTISPECIES: CopC domain-containing protein YobA [Kluyvera]|uniref:Copper resistance protein C n=1 Tax=Kluyvera sichuanensis TaxID=2725494 RepID=A0ABR6RRW4_9ENTR|nr:MULTISPECIES: CopC domain-containing protein YobA [Kluyvera]MBC1185864.1 CopC domain-containing protein YobA [Kluyvera sichuanensis]MBW9460519.1 CopC domain-containing protein YobA [Kluyvera sp. EC_51]